MGNFVYRAQVDNFSWVPNHSLGPIKMRNKDVLNVILCSLYEHTWYCLATFPIFFLKVFMDFHEYTNEIIFYHLMNETVKLYHW